MMADAACEREFLFGARREGLYFGGLNFAAKAALGLGALLAGAALDVVDFPKGATVVAAGTHVIPTIIGNLAWAAGPRAAAVSPVATAISVFLSYLRQAACRDRPGSSGPQGGQNLTNGLGEPRHQSAASMAAKPSGQHSQCGVFVTDR